MAVMEALLKIKADVTGEGQIDKLGRALGGLQNTAGKVSVGLNGLLGAAGGLSGTIGSLASMVTGAGLVTLAKGAIDAADDMHDLSMKTGVSVEQLSKFDQAAKMSGTTIDVVGGALTKLAKNMSASMGEAANAAGESAEEIKERTKRETDAAVDAVTLNMDRQVDAIKDSERKQLDAVNNGTDKKLRALDRESDARLDELKRRFRQEQKLLNDKYDDEADRQEDAAEDQQKTMERAIERSYEARIEAIQEDDNIDKQHKKQLIQNLSDQRDVELDVLRNQYEESSKLRRRAMRDREEAERDAIESRQKQEETALKEGFDRQREVVQRGAEAQKQAITEAAESSVEAVKRGAEASIAALNAAMDPVGALSGEMNELGLSGKGASEAFAKLGISIKDQQGNLRATDQVMLDIADKFKDMPDGWRKTTLAMQLFGKSGAQLIPFLNSGRESIEKLQATMGGDFAKAADVFNERLPMMQARLTMLGVAVAEALMPALQGIADLVIAAADGFSKLPGPLQAVIGGAAALTAAFMLLAPAISAAVSMLGGMAALNIGGAIAGWLPAVIGAAGGIVAALGGILTFITGTLIPGILAVVTGPVGLTVLLVAAIVALFVAFREPIMDFLSWVWENLVGGFEKIADWYLNVYVKFWVDLWGNLIVKPITGFLSWFGKVFMKGWESYVNSIRTVWGATAGFFTQAWQKAGQFIGGLWSGIINNLKQMVRNFIIGFIGAINAAIRAVNILIANFNKLPGPDLPFIGQVPVPEFAEGGVVDRPTLAMVGEGGEREYIIPESKMGRAAAAYLGGARGAAVMGSSTINVTTGPVLQQQGQNWVTMADLQQAMRATEAATLQRIRTPAGRAALGIR